MKIHPSVKIVVTVLSATLLVSLIVGSPGQNALAQTNQERTAAAAAAANLTAADFTGVTNDLITARLGILSNDSTSAYNAINTAGSDLFALNQDAAGGNETVAKELAKELRPVLSNLDKARDALRDSNNTISMRSLNTADLRLLDIIQVLPPGEEETTE